MPLLAFVDRLRSRTERGAPCQPASQFSILFRLEAVSWDIFKLAIDCPRRPTGACLTLKMQSNSATSPNPNERNYNYKPMCMCLTNGHLRLKPLILLNIGQLLDISPHRM